MENGAIAVPENVKERLIITGFIEEECGSEISQDSIELLASYSQEAEKYSGSIQRTKLQREVKTAIEVCDGKDNDFDQKIDENLKKKFYEDLDDDGFGSSKSQTLCQASGHYKSLKTGDCNDEDPSIGPGLKEICDEKDNDCDKKIDEGYRKEYFYIDNDKDGYGSSYWNARKNDFAKKTLLTALHKVVTVMIITTKSNHPKKRLVIK